MEALYGPERSAMLADLGWSDLQDALKDNAGPDTALHLDLAGRDPDDGLTDIAYEKGATFLRTLEAAVGRPRFDAFLRGYFDRNAFQPQTTARFREDLKRNLFNGDEAAMAAVKVDEWLYQPGLPANAVHIASPAFVQVDRLAAGDLTAPIPWEGWTTQERLRFLNSLPRTLSTAQLAALDRRFGLNDTGNSELRFAWLQLALPNGYTPARASAEQFLLSQGRRKFVAPLFTTLMAQPGWGPTLAQSIYARARPGYHSVTTSTVDQTVGYDAGKPIG